MQNITKYLICCPWNTQIWERIYLQWFISVKGLNLKALRKQLLSYFGEVIRGFKEHWTQHGNQDPPVKGKSSKEEFKQSPCLNSYYLWIWKYICVGNKGIAINVLKWHPLYDIHCMTSRELFFTSSFLPSLPHPPKQGFNLNGSWIDYLWCEW